jgi:predicted transcriptional regulator
MPLSRITITISPELLEAADRRAGELSRSRSWVLAEALGRYLSSGEEPTTRVAEPTATYAPGLGPSRQAQLVADLELTPEERVLIAEQTALIADLRGRRRSHDQVLTFDRYEDFLDWKDREASRP